MKETNEECSLPSVGLTEAVGGEHFEVGVKCHSCRPEGRCEGAGREGEGGRRGGGVMHIIVYYWPVRKGCFIIVHYWPVSRGWVSDAYIIVY